MEQATELSAAKSPDTNVLLTYRVDVVVVDDDAAVRELLVNMFIHHNAKVVAVNNGLEAARILRLSKPTVLVTDIFMPDMDGLELIRAAKDISPTTKVVAISGGHPRYGNFLDAATAFGADAIFGKPFGRELVDTVVSLLNEGSRSKNQRPILPRSCQKA